MARLAALLFLVPEVAFSARKRRRVVPKDNGLDAVETWDRFNTGVVAQNVSAQWFPCPVGMCWDSWGGYRKPEVPGVGGIGNRGCWALGCPDGITYQDCFFGPCPKYFGSPACVSSGSCGSYCDLAHAGSCTYTGPLSQESWHASWMSQFQSKPLNELIVLEAHHYLARLGTLDFYNAVQESNDILNQLAPLEAIPGLGDILRIVYASALPMWSSCQSSDAARLLMSGVRALDIRPYLSKTDNRLRDSHGGRGPEVEEALGQIAAFVQSHPSELVYVSLANLMAGDGNCLDCQGWDETYQRLNEAVQRHFGECGSGMLLCDVDITKTVGDLTRVGNVIVYTNSGGLHQRSGSPRRIHLESALRRVPWRNTNSLDTLKSRILGDAGLQAAAVDGKTLIGHQWIMTFTADDLIGGVSSKFTGNWQDKANRYGCQSLACFAEVASAESFRSFYNEVHAKYARSNFLMLDFADRPGGMDFIMWANSNEVTTTPAPFQRTCTDTKKNGCTAHPIDWYQPSCSSAHGNGYVYVAWEHCDTVFSARYICQRTWTCTQSHGLADCCR